MSHFQEGQQVLCIDDKFKPFTDNIKPTNKPYKGEILTIHIVERTYLRFLKYDYNGRSAYWMNKHFSPIDEAEIEKAIKELMESTELQTI